VIVSSHIGSTVINLSNPTFHMKEFILTNVRKGMRLHKQPNTLLQTGSIGRINVQLTGIIQMYNIGLVICIISISVSVPCVQFYNY
jgi:hypothetical protein